MRIVVTGSIGCGKSTVVKALQEQLPTHFSFDFDKMVHELYSNENVQIQMLSAFGTCERCEISNIVHSDPNQMDKLMQITNGFILAKVGVAFNENDAILDIPLWFEHIEAWGWKPDAVICVTCEPTIQRQRIKSRDGITDEKIDSILAKQLPQEEKARRSTFVVENNGPVDEVRERVVAFITGFPHIALEEQR